MARLSPRLLAAGLAAIEGRDQKLLVSAEALALQLPPACGQSSGSSFLDQNPAKMRRVAIQCASISEQARKLYWLSTGAFS